MNALRHMLLIGGLSMLSATRVELCADEARDKAQPAASLDQQLLDDLDNALLEGLDEEPSKKSSSGESPKSPVDAQDVGKKSTGSSGASQIDDELLRELGGKDSDGGAAQDPLVGIGRRMRNVESRLIDQKLDDQTRQMQNRILEDLAALLQECKKCQGGGNGKPGSKAGKGTQAGNTSAGQAPSDIARGSSEKLRNRKTQGDDTAALTSAMKESWGNLPQHLRHYFSNVRVDAFLPKYELMLEKYFKRLGEADAGE